MVNDDIVWYYVAEKGSTIAGIAQLVRACGC